MNKFPPAIARSGAIIAGTLIALGAAIAVATAPSSGWLTGLALALGVIAYAMMAVNMFLALRHPIIERLIGPLDRVYLLHRILGTVILAVIGVHLVLIPIASVVDRGVNILDNPGPPLVLGILGVLIIVASVILAVNTRIPYDRWQKIHFATVIGFLLLTLHALTGLSSWEAQHPVTLAALAGFALLGLVSLVIRVIDRARGGIEYTVTSVMAGPRGIEIFFAPAGSRRLRAHHAGQFAFLTATAGGRTETHPFTITAPEGDAQLSIFLRDSGDWTHGAQTGIQPGDKIRLSGPFGAFTPTQADQSRPQVWIAGGAGITPFLATIRTWHHTGRTAPVRLVYTAETAADAPAWEEISRVELTHSWLSIEPIFTQGGGRVDGDRIARIAADTGSADALWYVCGPAGLKDSASQSLQSAKHPVNDLHTEEYSWRDAPREARPA